MELWVLSGKQTEIEDADWHTDVVTKKGLGIGGNENAGIYKHGTEKHGDRRRNWMQ